MALRIRRCRHRLGQLQPLQHRIAVRLRRTGAQQPHHMAGRPGGRQLPAGLVPHRQALCFQQRANAARQCAVTVHQCHQPLPVLHFLLHAGGGHSSLIFQITCHMQVDRCPCGTVCPHGLLPLRGQIQTPGSIRAQGLPALEQRFRQGVALKAAHQHQRLDLSIIQCRIQPIRGVVGAARPGQRHLRHQGFVAQGLGSQGAHQLREQLLPPRRTLIGRLRHRQRHQLQGGFTHPSGQPASLAPLSCTFQQALGREQALCRIRSQVIRPRQEGATPRRPVRCGLETGQQSSPRQQGPLLPRHGQKLRIRQQHHTAAGVCAAGGQLLRHLLQQALPHRRNGHRIHAPDDRIATMPSGAAANAFALCQNKHTGRVTARLRVRLLPQSTDNQTNLKEDPWPAT